ADPAVADLSRAINFASVGSLAAVEGADTVFSPLIQTTDRAMTIDAARVAFNPQPDELLRDYLPGGEALTIAARISGPATSPFVDASELDKSAASADDEDAAPPTAVAEGTINVIVVADTDFLDDQFFARDNGLFVQITADNASFVLNALDNLLGSDALLALRARSPSDRPMTAVQELRARAETQYLIEEQRLQAELQATEARLSELETQPGEEGAAGFALSPQQEAEVRRFQNEMAGIRRDLRAVQRRLNADIEGLKGWLMFFNIWAVPLGLGAALWLGRGRSSRGGRGATS
ncbi:MAG: ABC transporter, partial [Pseudomonadota bacterium]